MAGSGMIGRYQVQKLLGQGNMGSVYLAFDPNLRRSVAIKTIRTHLRRSPKDSVSFKDRFFQEAQANSQLNHSAVINVYDSGIHNGEPFLVMEFVDGATLEDLLVGDLILEPMLRYQLLSDIASGLDYAHRHDIIHRDVKPTNVLVTRDGHAKIVDFGMAKLKDSNLTTTGVFLGTPSYASPEQILHGKIDHRADLFSFGIMAHEILTGKRPFPGENINSILYHIVHTQASFEFSVLDLEPAIQDKLRDVFSKVLAKEPEDRYDSASDFINDLESSLGMKPIRDWKPAPGTKLIAWDKFSPPEGVEDSPSLDETMLLEAPVSRKVSNPLPLVLGIGGAILVLVFLILALPGGKTSPAAEGALIVDAEQFIGQVVDPEQEALAEAKAAERASEESRLDGVFQDHVQNDDLEAAREVHDEMLELGFDTNQTVREKLLSNFAELDREARLQRRKSSLQSQFRTALDNKNLDDMKRVLTRYKRDFSDDAVVIESWENAVAEEEAELSNIIEQDRVAFDQAVRNRQIGDAELQLERLKRVTRDTEAFEDQLAELKRTTYINELGMRFILLEPGTFRMGPQSQPGKQPPHEVSLTKPVFLGMHEVTQAQWQAIMETNPSPFKGNEIPVYNISWQDAMAFIDKLNARDQNDVTYRLPTEAEWEYACRAGTETLFGIGDSLTVDAGNTEEKRLGNPLQVGSYQPNPWGFHEMNGNVAEWVFDFYRGDWHGQTTDPKVDNGSDSGPKVYRGGSFDSAAKDCSCGKRSRRQARSKDDDLGLRIAVERSQQ